MPSRRAASTSNHNVVPPVDGIAARRTMHDVDPGTVRSTAHRNARPAARRRRTDSEPAPTRARHVVDRALDYVALAEGGLTAAEIGRRRRKSKGYVSIVLRLGQALRGLTPEEVAAFRSERITWKLAQKVVRAGTDPAAIRRQLRAALGGFSAHNVDRRRHRKGRPTEPRAEPGVFAWRWDAAWAERDPVGYVAAYRTHLTLLHRGVGTRLRQAIAARSAPAPVPLAGQSLRQLSDRLAQQRPSGVATASRPEDREALRCWTELEAALGDLLAS